MHQLRQVIGLAETYSQPTYLRNVTRSYANIAALNTSSQNKARFKRLVNAVYNDLGLLLLVYSGQRTYAEQWELRKKYLAGGARAALPGWSWHPYGRAIDTVPLNSDGSANWNTRDWAKIHKLAESFGLEHGRAFGDPGHFLYRTGTTLENERAMNPGWEAYEQKEKDAGIMAQKDTESPGRSIKVGKILAFTGLGIAALLGARYLYRRYAT